MAWCLRVRFGRDETPQLERARIVPPEERIREPAVRAILLLVLVFGLAYGERLVRVARGREIRRWLCQGRHTLSPRRGCRGGPR
jgi:hypothetical protein